jgi:hypothetical protein
MMGKKVVAVPKPEKDEEKANLQDRSARLDIKLYKPGKYEVTKEDSFRVCIHIIHKDGRWIVLDPDEMKAERGVEKHWVDFRMWTFDEEIELRKAATTFDAQKRMHLIDHDVLNRLKVQRLLKSWSFSEGNDALKLFHQNGVLVDESYEAFTKLHPNIARYIIERMNNVLEYNG